tara:strand:- start:11249 stop:11692 length:444 start_codon:yes stop_codon:yes gene_type:complete
MKLLTLSLLTTEYAHIRLITETKEDANKLINSSNLLCSKTGEFESLDQQLEVKEDEVNLFENYRSAVYKAIDSDMEWSYSNGTQFKMKVTDKTDAEHHKTMAMEHQEMNGEKFESIDNLDDYEVDNDVMDSLGLPEDMSLMSDDLNY